MLANKEMCRWDGGCICRRVGQTMLSGGDARRASRRESSFAGSGNWRWKSSIRIRESRLPDRVVLGDAGYGDGTEFREELEKAETEIRRGCAAASRSMAEATQDHPAENYRQRAPRPRPATGINGRPLRKRRLGRQEVGERFAGAKGVKAGWSRAFMACVQPSHRYQDGSIRRARRYGYWLRAGVGKG